GGDHIMAAKCDLGWGLDVGESRSGVMGNDGIGLAEECVKRLHRAPADEGSERIDVVRLRRVELWSEAPRKYATYHHLGDAAKALLHGLPALDNHFEKRIRRRPAARQRQRPDAFGVPRGEPQSGSRSQ